MSELRNRSRGVFSSAPTARVNGLRYGTCSTAWLDIPAAAVIPCKVGVVETMSDIVTPRYRSRLAKGEVFFNPMTQIKTESRIDDPGYGYYRKTWNDIGCGVGLKEEIDYYGSFLPYWVNSNVQNKEIAVANPLISASDISGAITEVSTRCLADRGKADNNLFESFAEIHQAVSLLRHPLKSFYSFITKHGARAKLMSASEAWLTYRYGVKPLVRDVTTIITGLEKKIGKRRKTTRARLDLRQIDTSTVNGGDSVCRIIIGKQISDTISFRAMSLDEYVATKASNIGFETKELITLPWELIPYSFVADWFANIGDYLNALAPAPGYQQLGSCLVTVREIKSEYTAQGFAALPIGAPTFNITRGASGKCSSVKTTRTRSVLGRPGLVIRSDFRFDNAVRMADAFSLLALRMDALFGSRKVRH